MRTMIITVEPHHRTAEGSTVPDKFQYEGALITVPLLKGPAVGSTTVLRLAITAVVVVAVGTIEPEDAVEAAGAVGAVGAVAEAAAAAAAAAAPIPGV